MQDWLAIISSRCRQDDCAFKDTKTGKRARTFKPLTQKLLALHLNLTYPVFYGGYLMLPGESTTRLAVLDVDDHSGELGWDEVLRRGQTLAFELQEEGYSPALFRSSGGKGLHVWLYWDAPQDAYSVRQMLTDAVISAGFEAKAGVVEVFPKQDRIEPDGCGNPMFFPIEWLDKREWKASPPVPMLEHPVLVTIPHAVGGGDLVKLADALKALPNDAEEPADYDTWLKVGMAVHHASGGSDDGLALWNDWSRTNPNYDAATQVTKWDSFGGKGGGVTEATIYRLALDRGWQWSPLDGIEKLMEAGKKFAGETAPAKKPRRVLKLETETPGITDKWLPETKTGGAMEREELTPTEWVIPNMLCVGLGLIAGKPKSKKSWLALDLAITVAKGGIFMGKNLPPSRRVMFLALEDSEWRLKDRLTKMGQRPVPDEFIYATEWRKGYIDALIEEARIQQPRLIVVDVWGKFKKSAGAKGDQYENEYQQFDPLKKLAHEISCAVVIVHHLRKSASEDDPLDTIHGSIATAGVMDTIWLLKSNRGSKTGSMLITGRDVEEQELALQWDENTWRWENKGSQEMLEQSGQSEEQKKLLGLLRDNPHGLTANELADMTGRKRENIYHSMSGMQKKGLTTKNKNRFLATPVGLEKW